MPVSRVLPGVAPFIHIAYVGAEEHIEASQDVIEDVIALALCFFIGV